MALLAQYKMTLLVEAFPREIVLSYLAPFQGTHETSLIKVFPVLSPVVPLKGSVTVPCCYQRLRYGHEIEIHTIKSFPLENVISPVVPFRGPDKNSQLEVSDPTPLPERKHTV